MKRIQAFASAIKARKGKKALGKALSISVLNQVVSSGTNFALGIYFVRMLPPAEFGLYGIGFAISLFYAGIGNALFLTQMVVHAPDKAPEDRLPYAGRMFLLVVLFCSATLFLATMLLLLGGFLFESVAHHAQLVGATIAASVAYLLKDFFVRHAYNVRHESWSLSIHGAIAITMAVLLGLQHQNIPSLNVEMALWMYATAQASGAILGCLVAKLPVAVHHRSELHSDLREALEGGKWASVTNLVYFARTQAYTIVVGAVLGPVAVAKINAARLLVTPAIMLMPALSQVVMPRLAAVRNQGASQLLRLGRWFSVGLLAVALFYSVILLSCYDSISNIVFGGHYNDLFLLTAIWCFWTILSCVRNGIALVAQVLKKFKEISNSNIVAAILSLGGTYVFTITNDLPGALAGVVLSEVLLIIMLFRVLIVAANSK